MLLNGGTNSSNDPHVSKAPGLIERGITTNPNPITYIFTRVGLGKQQQSAECESCNFNSSENSWQSASSNLLAGNLPKKLVSMLTLTSCGTFTKVECIWWNYYNPSHALKWKNQQQQWSMHFKTRVIITSPNPIPYMFARIGQRARTTIQNVNLAISNPQKLVSMLIPHGSPCEPNLLLLYNWYFNSDIAIQVVKPKYIITQTKRHSDRARVTTIPRVWFLQFQFLTNCWKSTSSTLLAGQKLTTAVHVNLTSFGTLILHWHWHPCSITIIHDNANNPQDVNLATSIPQKIAGSLQALICWPTT